MYLQEQCDDPGIVDDPRIFLQAIRCNESDKWLDATKDELSSMKANQVCDLVPLPKGLVLI